MKRRRIAILSSFFRLGQWRGIVRYGLQAGWICQRIGRDTLSRLKTWQPDGVLFQVDEFDTPMLKFVADCELPKVGLRALAGAAGGGPLVLPDLADFGRRIASHFVSRNFHRLCYLGPAADETANSGITHFVGMREVARRHDIPLEGFFPDQPATWKALGLTPPPRRSSTDWDRFWELGAALIDHLTRTPEPVALFSAFAEPAMQFMEMVDGRGLAIPNQIGMAAQTEDSLNGLVTKVPLTCLVPDYELQGYTAAQLLEQMLEGRLVAPGHQVFLPDCELVLRESSNQIVTSDPSIGAMLEHVRQNALDPGFTPEALAAAFGRSLRMLQMRFRKGIQRGIAQVIREVRTLHATDLILNTDLSLKEVVARSGFGDHHQLERAVRTSHGTSPSALRKQGADVRARRAVRPGGGAASKVEQ